MFLRKKRGVLTPHKSSIILSLDPLFKARNISTPLTFLLKNGISNFSAQKMLNGKNVQINYRQLTSLCLALNCAPNDLFALRQMTLPENHALKVLRTISDEALPTIQEWMIGKTIEEITELLRS